MSRRQDRRVSAAGADPDADREVATAGAEDTEEVATTRLAGTARIIGANIRQLRERSGMTQGELAHRVYVSRQTINNWEGGRTLPDVESLKLLSETFGISVDALMGQGAVTLADETAADRHRLLVSLVVYGALDLVFILLCLFGRLALALWGFEIEYGSEAYYTKEALNLAISVIMLVLLIAELPAGHCIRKVMDDHELRDAVAVMAYLEGRNPERNLPDDILYRFVLPNWQALRAVIPLSVVLLMLLVYLVMTAAS